jgi:hypothetical protein
MGRLLESWVPELYGANAGLHNAIGVKSLRAKKAETKIRFCNWRLITVIRTALREVILSTF